MTDIRKLAEHSIDVDLLPDAPRILDVGCRDFGFDRMILELRPMAKIIAIDPDPVMEVPSDIILDGRIMFLRIALTASKDQRVWYQERGGEANAIVTGRLDAKTMQVPNLTMQQMLNEFWPYYDVVKLDCEGSEFEILEQWPGKIAGQISVEFHDYTNWMKWDDRYFQKLFAGPLRDYQIVQHERFGIGPGNDQGHWDSLLVLR